MRALFSLWLPFLLMAGLPTVAVAHESSLQVEWRCVRSSIPDLEEGRAPPLDTGQMITVSWDATEMPDSEKGRLKVSGLSELISLSQKTPHDIQSCFEDLRSRLQEKIWEQCKNNLPTSIRKKEELHHSLWESQPSNCEREANELVLPLEEQLKQVPDRERMAPPAVIPLQKVGDRAAKEFEAQSSMTELCSAVSDGFQNHPLKGYWLSAEFWRDSVSGLPSECQNRFFNFVLNEMGSYSTDVEERCARRSVTCQQERSAIRKIISQIGRKMSLPQEVAESCWKNSSTETVGSGITLNLFPLQWRLLEVAHCQAPVPGAKPQPPWGHLHSSRTLQDSKTTQLDIDVEIQPSVVSARFVETVNQCLAWGKPMMTQKEGQSVLLRLNVDHGKKGSYAAEQIQVRKEGNFRANSKMWPDPERIFLDKRFDPDRSVEQADYCLLAIHEALHLAGLVDEYSEPAHGHVIDKSGKRIESVSDCAEAMSGFTGLGHWLAGDRCALLYDCRSISKEPNLMASQYDAFIAYRANPSRSVFRQDQFNKIAFPECGEKNERYNSCERNAYNTSKTHGGQGCDKTECHSGREGEPSWL